MKVFPEEPASSLKGTSFLSSLKCSGQTLYVLFLPRCLFLSPSEAFLIWRNVLGYRLAEMSLHTCRVTVMAVSSVGSGSVSLHARENLEERERERERERTLQGL